MLLEKATRFWQIFMVIVYDNVNIFLLYLGRNQLKERVEEKKWFFEKTFQALTLGCSIFQICKIIQLLSGPHLFVLLRKKLECD